MKRIASLKASWARLNPEQRRIRLGYALAALSRITPEQQRRGTGWPKMSKEQQQLATHNRWHIGSTLTKYGVHINKNSSKCNICNNITV